MKSEMTARKCVRISTARFDKITNLKLRNDGRSPSYNYVG
jgi:hypothetical protein